MKKLILFFLTSFSCFVGATSGAGSVVCQNLFGSDEIEKSIHALAGLRYQLDEAKVSGQKSLSLSTLEQQYQKKEQALLNYFLVNKTMTREEFLKRIDFEIAERQKDASKIDAIKNGHSTDIENSIPGRQMRFHEFRSNDEEIRNFEVMFTPTTQIIWKKIAELINSKLDSKYHVPTAPSKVSGDLFPITNVSYMEVVKWISGLNELSRMGDIKLKDIILDHQSGHIYKLPSEGEWTTFLKNAYHDLRDAGNFSFRSDEEVSISTLFTVGDQKYYGLSQLRQFLEHTGNGNFTNYMVPYILWVRERNRHELDLRLSGVSFDLRDDYSFRLIRRKASP